MSAEDFRKPGVPTLAQWSKAVDRLWDEGVRLATVRASGKHAADYYNMVSERAYAIMRSKPLPLPPIMRSKPLPLPPIKRALPLPPRPLPMPGAAT